MQFIIYVLLTVQAINGLRGASLEESEREHDLHSIVLGTLSAHVPPPSSCVLQSVEDVMISDILESLQPSHDEQPSPPSDCPTLFNDFDCAHNAFLICADPPNSEYDVVNTVSQGILGLKRALEADKRSEGLQSKKSNPGQRLRDTVAPMLLEKSSYDLDNSINWENCSFFCACGGSKSIASNKPAMFYLQIPNIDAFGRYAFIIFNHESLYRGLRGLTAFIRGSQVSKAQSFLDSLESMLQSTFGCGGSEDLKLLQMDHTVHLYQMIDGGNTFTIDVGAGKNLFQSQVVVLTNSVSLNYIDKRSNNQIFIEFLDAGIQPLRQSLENLLLQDTELKLPSCMALVIGEIDNLTLLGGHKKELLASQNIADPALRISLLKSLSTINYVGAKFIQPGINIDRAIRSIEEKGGVLDDVQCLPIINSSRMMLVNLKINAVEGVLFIRTDTNLQQMWNSLQKLKTQNAFNNIKYYVSQILEGLTTKKISCLELDGSSLRGINKDDYVYELQMTRTQTLLVPDIEESWVAKSSAMRQHLSFVKITEVDKALQSTQLWRAVKCMPTQSYLIAYRKETSATLTPTLGKKNGCDTQTDSGSVTDKSTE